jgi:hypothetical protein
MELFSLLLRNRKGVLYLNALSRLTKKRLNFRFRCYRTAGIVLKWRIHEVFGEKFAQAKFFDYFFGSTLACTLKYTQSFRR